jgi:mono/diheme cytochrome c family protein/plastocyanin
MTDEHRDRPGAEPERRLPARRPPSEPVPSRSAERFTAPRSTRAIAGLTSERAAKIVRQSGDARWVAFLGVTIVALFVIIYYFYEIAGIPVVHPDPRLQVEESQQAVVAIERGYNLYQANCARCHGVNGEGGVGPVLNDQMKLFSHLNEQYLHTVLEVGGRYVCGNPKSVMPVWSQENGGPLNYIQLEDLVAFIRAPNTQEYTRRDPELNEPVLNPDGTVQKFKGWRDPEFKPDPAATAVPDCYLGDGGGGTPAPAESLPPDATVLELGTSGVLAYDKTELTAPAGEAFAIHFNNSDAGQTHDVDIREDDGMTVVQDQATQITGPAEVTYVYEPLEAGTYKFICQVHPIPAMTGTLTVE